MNAVQIEPLNHWATIPIPSVHEESDGLGKGRWIVRGGVQHWEAHEPQSSDVVTRVFATIERNLREKHVPLPTLPTCACGCLLASQTEPCPACAWNHFDVDWCEQAAIEASWRPIYYRPAEAMEVAA